MKSDNWRLDNRGSSVYVRLISNDCGFPWQCTVNCHPTHSGCTFKSCGTPGLAPLEVTVCPMKSTAESITIRTQRYDSYIFSAGWLKRWPMRLEVHPAGIWTTWHAVKWGAASYLYIIVNQPHCGSSWETAIVWSQPCCKWYESGK